MRTIDLNCDMGEGCGNDIELLEYVSSANVACGFHAGDPTIMRKTVEAAIAKGVAIGAHPSFPDRDNFGRTQMDIPPDEVRDLVVYQIGAMRSMCQASGGKLNHVKPHGALYNMAAGDRELAAAIADAVRGLDESLVLYGLSGSALIDKATRAGLATASEVFADRTYQLDGSLTPRSMPNALIRDAEAALEQVLKMVEQGTVAAANGGSVKIAAETICIHGDGEHAVEFARVIYQGLTQRDIRIKSISKR